MLVKIEVSNDNGQALTRHFFYCVGDAPYEQMFTSFGEPIITPGWNYDGFTFALIGKKNTPPKRAE